MIRVGRQVGGLAAMALGAANLYWRDFSVSWQRVPPDAPFRTPLVYLVAGIFLVAGAALFWRRTARPALLVLAALYGVFTLLHVAHVAGAPAVYDGWNNVAEQLSAVTGCLAAWACLAPATTPGTLRVAHGARMAFGVCGLSFGTAHFVYLKPCADFIPAWIPDHTFWAAATGVADILAGLAILSGVWALLAARLQTLMFIGFGVLVWGDIVLRHPEAHTSWSGNAVNLSLVGAAWMIADSIAQFPPRDGQLFTRQRAD